MSGNEFEKNSMIVLALFAVAFIGLVVSCKPAESIKIGFIADLSGRQSQLGIETRNAFLLAVQKLNDEGGLDNRHIVTYVKDNQFDPEVCFERTVELVEADVDVIIGPLTSVMAKPVLAAAKDILVISPTVSTDQLTDLDDMFFRVIPSAKMQGVTLAEEIIRQKKERIAIIVDEANHDYTQSVLNGILMAIANEDINPIISPFYDRSEFSGMVLDLIDKDPDALVIISSSSNAATFIQQYAKRKEVPQLFGSSWVKSNTILENGGRIVEGMIIVGGYENKIPSEKELVFQKEYKNMFDVFPNYSSKYVYESVLLYAEAVKSAKTTDQEKIKSELLSFQEFQGISDSYRFNEFGDVIRSQSLFVIRNNYFYVYEGD